jgi:hypothetical protein
MYFNKVNTYQKDLRRISIFCVILKLNEYWAEITWNI